MESPITANHFTDANGNPAGGITYGHGFTIAWQNGPLRNVVDGTPVGRNGAFVEDIIRAAVDRIDFYQGNHPDSPDGSKFACEENGNALLSLREAVGHLNRRTERRVAAGVEGTHEGN